MARFGGFMACMLALIAGLALVPAVQIKSSSLPVPSNIELILQPAPVALEKESPRISDEVLVVEQFYRILKIGDGGVDPKYVKQKLYFHRDWMRIDDFADEQATLPAETFFIDFKARKIYDEDNLSREIHVVTFEERREKIAQNIKDVQRDLKNMDDGPQRKKFLRLSYALLDQKRNYAQFVPPAKTPVAGVACQVTEIFALDEPYKISCRIALHPDIELPCDYAEVLYLLKILGPGLREYLCRPPPLFHRLPMDLDLDLAVGGRLQFRVWKVERVRLNRLDPGLAKPPAFQTTPQTAPPKSR